MQVRSLGQEDPLEEEYSTPHRDATESSLLVVKNPLPNAGNINDAGSIPGSGRSPGEGNGYLFQYSCLENPMDRGAWWLQFIGLQRVGHDLETKQPPLSCDFNLYFSNV